MTNKAKTLHQPKRFGLETPLREATPEAKKGLEELAKDIVWCHTNRVNALWQSRMSTYIRACRESLSGLVHQTETAIDNLIDNPNTRSHYNYITELNSLYTQLNVVASAIPNYETEAARCCDRLCVLSDAIVYKELISIYEMFPGLEWSLQKKYIAVITQPIKLHYSVANLLIDLGSFRVVIHYAPESNTANTYYRVVPIEPKYPYNNPTDYRSYPHPHINGGVLCEGAGRNAISRALLQYRWLDALQVINSILGTYNPRSPYIPLEAWVSKQCTLCGRSVIPTEENVCPGCKRTYCGECINMVKWCETCTSQCTLSRCGMCTSISKCSKCNKYYCAEHYPHHECQPVSQPVVSAPVQIQSLPTPVASLSPTAVSDYNDSVDRPLSASATIAQDFRVSGHTGWARPRNQGS